MSLNHLAQTLADLPAGARVRLISVEGERAFRRRLMEMGLLPGTEIEVVRRVGVGRVVQLAVRGCQVTLRLSEARGLIVEPTEG